MSCGQTLKFVYTLLTWIAFACLTYSICDSTLWCSFETTPKLKCYHFEMNGTCFGGLWTACIKFKLKSGILLTSCHNIPSGYVITKLYLVRALITLAVIAAGLAANAGVQSLWGNNEDIVEYCYHEWQQRVPWITINRYSKLTIYVLTPAYIFVLTLIKDICHKIY